MPTHETQTTSQRNFPESDARILGSIRGNRPRDSLGDSFFLFLRAGLCASGFKCEIKRFLSL